MSSLCSCKQRICKERQIIFRSLGSTLALAILLEAHPNRTAMWENRTWHSGRDLWHSEPAGNDTAHVCHFNINEVRSSGRQRCCRGLHGGHWRSGRRCRLGCQWQVYRLCHWFEVLGFNVVQHITKHTQTTYTQYTNIQRLISLQLHSSHVVS